MTRLRRAGHGLVGWLRRVRHALREGWRRLEATSTEVMLAVLCLLSGMQILLTSGRLAPSSVLSTLPVWAVLCWASVLTLGGLWDVAGVLIPNLYLRRAGLSLLSSGAFVMGFTVIALTGYRRALVAGTYLIFAWAMWSVYQQLGKVLWARRRMIQQVAKHRARDRAKGVGWRPDPEMWLRPEGDPPEESR